MSHSWPEGSRNWEYGNSLLILEPDHVPWEYHEGLDATLKAMNLAFDIYYRARQNQIYQPNTEKMDKSITDSFTAGSGNVWIERQK